MSKATGNEGTVAIDYQQRDGLHIFTSRDFPGLFVARRDIDQARKEVPIALKKLSKLAGRSAVPTPNFINKGGAS